MAEIFPSEADKRALKVGISLFKAITNATSEEKGRMVAARNAETNRAISDILV